MESASLAARGQSTASHPPSPLEDDFEATMDSLSPLVEEIASRANATRGASCEQPSTCRASMEGVQAPPHGEERATSGQAGSTSWWALKGFLADPCVTLSATLPSGPHIASIGGTDLLEAWRQQYFLVSIPVILSFLLSHSRSTNEFLLQQSAELARILSVHDHCLTSSVPEIKELKAKLAESRATITEL